MGKQKKMNGEEEEVEEGDVALLTQIWIEGQEDNDAPEEEEEKKEEAPFSKCLTSPGGVCVNRSIAQRSDAWKKLRKKAISATRISNICGLDPQGKYSKTMDQELFECRNGVEAEMNHHMQRGVDFEPIAARMYTERFGIMVDTETGVVQREDLPGLMVSPDGLIWDDAKTRIIHGVEIKAPGWAKTKWMVPISHIAQMLTCAWVCRVGGWDYGQITKKNMKTPHYTLWFRLYVDMLPTKENRRTRLEYSTETAAVTLNLLCREWFWPYICIYNYRLQTGDDSSDGIKAFCEREKLVCLDGDLIRREIQTYIKFMPLTD